MAQQDGDKAGFMTPKTPRIFKNWYTRNGKRIPARGWCVRIQHLGLRRTLSLKATNRKAALVEAEALCGQIKDAGWPAVSTVRKSAVPR